MHQDLIKRVLADAVYAPSGENSQPWRFEVKDNVIEQYYVPDKDNPIYNYNNRGSYFAHGALLFNLKILFKANGFDSNVILFPNGEKNNLVAKITLTESEKYEDQLVVCIKKRSTNRKKYTNQPLTKEQKDELEKVAKEFKDVEFHFVESESDKQRLSKIFSINDRILLENKSIHCSVFSNLCWTDEEEKTRKSGLYVKTMELAPPQLAVFKMLKHWKVAKIFTRVGMTKFIASENAKIYQTGSAYLYFLINKKEVNYVHAGMLAQKIWLLLTKWGLSAHPLAALPYLYERVVNIKSDDFSSEHIGLIKDSYKQMQDIYHFNDDKIIAMTLRVGDGGEVSGFSSRKEPSIHFKY